MSVVKVEKSIDYSIVICTYNTDDRIFRRCLEAVAALDRTDVTTEVILTDNNSNPPVKDLDYVKKAVANIPGFRHLFVEKQGVQYARMEAIRSCKGQHIVYIDADNAPENDYLQQLRFLHDQFPRVGAWGPGNVSVDFLDGVDPSLEGYARSAFQERHEETEQMADKKEWQPCYPFGTGLCMRREILTEYVSIADQGNFSLEGRKGEALSSGEDTQMVMLCIRKGSLAGVSPRLRLTHLIGRERANPDYMKRLAFGTAVCYHPAMLQVFPEREQMIKTSVLSPGRFARKALKKLLFSRRGSADFFEAVHFIGLHAGHYKAAGKPLPPVIRSIIYFFKIK